MPPTVIGVPGNSARFIGWLDRLGLPLIVGFSMLLALPFLPRYDSLVTSAIVYTFVFGGPAAIFWRPLSEMYREYRGSKKWLQGADGESLAGAELVKLPSEYVVFHDFHPIGNDGERAEWNIDHVVIGPTGVFVIETKNYSHVRVQPAADNPYTRKNVKQTHRTAAEFENALNTWSGGALASRSVVPILVYVQPDAYVVKPQEGPVKVIPLKWLVGDITGWKGHPLDLDQTYRIARVLFSQLRPDLRNDFAPTLNAFGERSKHFKLDRAAARMQERATAEELPIPSVCPKCGGALVRRTAKKGDRKGKAFLGCANFVKQNCRFIVNLGE